MLAEILQLCFVNYQEVEWQFLKPCSSSRQHDLDKGVTMYYT